VKAILARFTAAVAALASMAFVFGVVTIGPVTNGIRWG
jgi:hypothetical protein